MSERISDERRKQIKERCEKATPGKWKMCFHASSGKPSGIVAGREYAVVVREGFNEQAYIDWKQNADFIAHARTDIPDLLAALTERDQLVREMAQASKELLAKMDLIEHSASYESVWTVAFAHGCRYDGPKWELERERLRFVLKGE